MRWDDRRLEDRIKAEARWQQIDLSKYVTIQQAAAIMHSTERTVLYRYDWLEGIQLCGRKFVKRNRTEWLQRFRDGELTSDDQMGESLAPFDVKAAREQIERRKREEEERRKQEAEANRPKGFHVDAYGGLWWDNDNNDTWVTVRQAALNLDITPGSVNALADRGVIRRRWAHRFTYQPVESITLKRMRGYLAMFSLRDIEAYAERRNNRGRRRSVSFNDPDRPFTPTRVYEMERSAHENCILPMWKVADILGVNKSRVSQLVSRGKLKAYSSSPGRPGVPLWFSQKEVLAFAKSEDHVKRRRHHDEYVKQKRAGTWAPRDHPPYQPGFGHPFIYEGVRDLEKDHGEYYTLRQAARVLGCSTQTVREKVKKGTLKGSRAAEMKSPYAKWNDKRWWFIKKEDLHDYKASREYRKRHRAWLKGKHPDLFPDDRPTRPPKPELKPPPDGLPHDVPVPLESPAAKFRREMAGW